MGKSWKEKPGKYRHNKDFQKKQKQKHKKMSMAYPPSEFIPESDLGTDMGVQGCDDFETCG